MRRASGTARRAGAIVALTLAAVVGPATAAEAHALVRSSIPANGTEVAKAPPFVIVTFTQPADPQLSFLHVLDSTGKDVERGPSRAVRGKPLELEVPLPSALSNGTYTITWRAVSKVDGHVTGGFLAFGVGVRPATGGSTRVLAPTTPPPPPVSVVGRWLFYWGLAALFGSASSGLFVRSGLPRRGIVVLVAGWVAAAVGLVLMTLAERSVIGVSFGALLRSGTGHEYIERAIAVAVAGLGVLWFALRPGRTALAALGITAAATMLVHVIAGHAPETSRSWFNVGVQWFHVLAVAAWIGGLVWLLFSLRALEGEDRSRTIRRFSMMAGLSLGVVALTGLSRALDEVGWPQHWARLFDTSYGITVLVKVALFLPLVVLGARNRYVNVPAATRHGRVRSLGRTAAAELGIAALIFAATGVVSELPPSATVAQAKATPTAGQQLVLVGHDFATTTRVHLTVSPGTVGPNRFVARVTDFDTGRPVPATSVTLAFALPSQPNLGQQMLGLRRAHEVWTGQGTTISMFGTWAVEVTVQEAATSTTIPLRLTPNLPPEQIVQTAATGQPTLYTIALSGGSSLQTYSHPGRPGNDTVHFTFFMANGNELPITGATGMAVPPGGAVTSLPLIRFDTGHFVANTTLTAGRWRFVIQVTPATGAAITAYFDQVIR